MVCCPGPQLGRLVSNIKKAAVKCVLLTLFFARLRPSEFLTQKSSSADIKCDVMASDLTFWHTIQNGVKKRSVTIWIRGAKVKKDFGDTVTLPEIVEQPSLCPYRALKKYLRYRKYISTDLNLPVILTESLFSHKKNISTTGMFGYYSIRSFNSDIKQLVASLGPRVQNIAKQLTAHSLRAGVVTELRSLEGIDDLVLKSLGRWNSEAFRIYCRDRENDRIATSHLESHYVDLIVNKKHNKKADEIYD